MGKIVILSTRFDLGGASLLATEVAARLRERGHDAEAWCMYFHSERHAPPDHWVRVLFPREPAGIRDLISMTNALRSLMKQFRPDAFFGVQPLANVLGALTATVAGCPRRVGGQHNPSQSQRRTLRALEKLTGMLLYTTNVAVSEAVRETFADYPKLYRRKMTVIRNGIGKRSQKWPQENARERFGLPRRGFLAGTIGQHDTDQKNHDFLIELLPLVPHMHLAIAGDGRRHGHLLEKAAALGVAGRTHLLGSIPKSSADCFLDALDVFLFPSRFEGCSLALLEAMQSGLPIIGNDIATIREALCAADEQCGILIPTDRPEKWRDALIGLQDDVTDRARWSRRAMEAAQLFSFDRMVGAYEQVALCPQGG